MEAWKQKDYNAMYASTHKTFVYESDLNEISEFFGNFQIDDFKIGKLTAFENEVVANYELEIYFGGNWEGPIKASIVCEAKPFCISKYGTWGVNPLSFLPK